MAVRPIPLYPRKSHHNELLTMFRRCPQANHLSIGYCRRVCVCGLVRAQGYRSLPLPRPFVPWEGGWLTSRTKILSLLKGSGLLRLLKNLGSADSVRAELMKPGRSFLG
jgi:hypothetical protein